MQGSSLLLSQPNKKKDVVVGIAAFGECGTNTIALLAMLMSPEKYPDLRLCAANTDGPKLYQTFLADHVDKNIKNWLSPGKEKKGKKEEREELPPQLWVVQLGDWGTGAGGDPEIGRKGAEMQREALKEFIDSVDVVIIVTGLGGGTGTGATPVVVQIAQEAGKFPLVVATLPFGFEGKRKIDRAGAAHAELLATVPTISVYNDRLPDKKITYEEAWKKTNEGGLLPPLNFLLQLLTVVGKNINRDLADYGALLRAGNNIFSVGIEKVGEEETPGEIVTRLLEGNPFQDSKIVEEAEFIILAFNGHWNVDETMQISKSVEDRVSITGKSLEINFFVGEVVGEKSVSMLISAKVPAPVKKANVVEEMASFSAIESHHRPQLMAAVTSIVPEPDRSTWEIIMLPQGWNGTVTKEVRVPPQLAERWRTLKRPALVGNGGGTTSTEYQDEFSEVRDEIMKLTGFAPSHGPAIHSS